jgi:hypothetical protein
MAYLIINLTLRGAQTWRTANLHMVVTSRENKELCRACAKEGLRYIVYFEENCSCNKATSLFINKNARAPEATHRQNRTIIIILLYDYYQSYMKKKSAKPSHNF